MSISCAIMQPYFFPYLGYFQLIDSVDVFVVYDEVQMIKNGWVNRNRLLTRSGHIFYFTAPTKSTGFQSKIKDVQIANDYWRVKLIKSLTHEYRHKDYFEETITLVDRLLLNKSKFISSLNSTMIEEFCRYLDIKTNIHHGPSMFNDLEHALRIDNDDKLETRYRRIFHMCQYFNATKYINPIGGMDIYSKAIFRDHGISLSFLRMKPTSYYQGEFSHVSSLSIIDVLMNCGRDKTRRMLSDYSLL